MKTAQRPHYLNLFTLAFPVMAVLSICHRISGIFLTVSLPYFLFLLDLSVGSKSGFLQVKDTLQTPLASMMLLLCLWAFSLHFWSGLRFLLLDAHIGLHKRTSQIASWFVLVISPLSAFLLWRLL